jgi:hypothetical protein
MRPSARTLPAISALKRGACTRLMDNAFGNPYDGPRAPVAQLDRVLVSETKGRRFESCRAHHLYTPALKSNALKMQAF